VTCAVVAFIAVLTLRGVPGPHPAQPTPLEMLLHSTALACEATTLTMTGLNVVVTTRRSASKDADALAPSSLLFVLPFVSGLP
jgi:hypothetical protein